MELTGERMNKGREKVQELNQQARDTYNRKVSESSLNALLSDLLEIVEKSTYKKEEICRATGLGFCAMKEKRERVIEGARRHLGR